MSLPGQDMSGRNSTWFSKTAELKCQALWNYLELAVELPLIYLYSEVHIDNSLI